jgi:hypothetical protein
MADRRPDDRPLAPRRPLSGPAPSGGAGTDEPTKQPVSKRMSAAVEAAGNAAQAAASRPARSSGATATGRGTTGPAAAGRGEQASAASPTKAAVPRRKGTRRARLRLVHLDPWSVMKTSFLLSIALGIVTVVAVAVVWSVLDAAGVWDSINQTVGDVLGGDATQTFDVKDYVGTSRVLGFTMIVAVVDVVLITAISTLGAFLYNLAAALLGGVEVTLAEDER